MIKKEELEKLAKLARIKLSEEELVSFHKDIASVISFVEQIQDVKLDELILEDKDEDVFHMLKNKFREDNDPHSPGAYSEEILNEVPQREGNYIKVKKIL